MGRKTIENSKFEFNFGVDHVTGLFCDAFTQPSNEQDSYLFMVNNTGVFITEEEALPSKTVALLKRYAEQMGLQVNQFSPGQKHIGHEGIVALARSLDLPVDPLMVRREVD